MLGRFKVINPKVSIICITYNQEKFIQQAMESFIMQKTNFSFEVIIGEDCSTDNTANIIRDFEKKYPTIIRTIYRDKNIGLVDNLIDVLKHAKGEYIALCEGDDFFIDENKIQLQADFLDKHKDYAICFHPVKVFFENNLDKEFIFPVNFDNSKFTVKELLKENFIQTNSVMYRKYEYEGLTRSYVLPYDWYLHLYQAQFGQIGFINKVMSVYRRHTNGIWWESYINMDELLKKNGIAHLGVFFEFINLYGSNKEYKIIILNNINYLLSKFIEIDEKDNSVKLLERSFQNFPNYLADYFSTFRLSSLNKKLESKSIELENVSTKFNQIVNSKKWKLIVKLSPTIPIFVKKFIIWLIKV